ncbi:MAG: hypothetical protein H0T40_08870 [Geodermatophilaceae bacterium]|nr:hypothetical protein [Geodermatophilaceae bacterium]
MALDPATDFAALFPGIDVRDLSLVDLNINAVSTGGIAKGYFDYLRFSRQSSGQMPLQAQADLEAVYAGQYPSVTQRQGLEVSMGSPHLNWFSGGISLPDYSGISGTFEDFLQHSLVPFIHDRDGLVSYNHPYGTGSRFSLDQPTQDELLRQTASRMVSNDALGSDILEVGYPLRGGVDLRHHIELWDVCSRNALFLTGNGVKDAHHGTNWAMLNNDWTTLSVGPGVGRGQPPASTAVRTSVVRVPHPVPRSPRPSSRRKLPDGVGICISVGAAATYCDRHRHSGRRQSANIQGGVDYAGPSQPAALSSVISAYEASELTTGSVAVSVDTSNSSFVRTQVLDSTGAVVAPSNPVWLLREMPGSGIPAARAS